MRIIIKKVSSFTKKYVVIVLVFSVYSLSVGQSVNFQGKFTLELEQKLLLTIYAQENNIELGNRKQLEEILKKISIQERKTCIDIRNLITKFKNTSELDSELFLFPRNIVITTQEPDRVEPINITEDDLVLGNKYEVYSNNIGVFADLCDSDYVEMIEEVVPDPIRVDSDVRNIVPTGYQFSNTKGVVTSSLIQFVKEFRNNYDIAKLDIPTVILIDSGIENADLFNIVDSDCFSTSRVLQNNIRSNGLCKNAIEDNLDSIEYQSSQPISRQAGELDMENELKYWCVDCSHGTQMARVMSEEVDPNNSQIKYWLESKNKTDVDNSLLDIVNFIPIQVFTGLPEEINSVAAMLPENVWPCQSLNNLTSQCVFLPEILRALKDIALEYDLKDIDAISISLKTFSGTSGVLKLNVFRDFCHEILVKESQDKYLADLEQGKLPHGLNMTDEFAILVKYLEKHGIKVFIAAGSQGIGVTWPGCIADALTVGHHGNYGGPGWFSSDDYAANIDIIAPGGNYSYNYKSKKKDESTATALMAAAYAVCKRNGGELQIKETGKGTPKDVTMFEDVCILGDEYKRKLLEKNDVTILREGSIF